MKDLILGFLILVSSCVGVGEISQYAFGQCGDKDFERRAINFKHKTSEEILALSPDERMDQMLLEHLFHKPWTKSNDANYHLLHKLLIEDSLKILPKASEYVTSYNPKNGFCKEFNEAKLHLAAQYVNAVDDRKFRVRATKNGEKFLKELEAAIELKRKENHGEDRISLLSSLLEQMKGGSIRDEILQSTFKEKHSVDISHEELNMLTEFLISVDPAYPSWSEVDSDAPPYTFKNPKKFFDAYKQFKDKGGFSGFCANTIGIDEFRKVDKIAASKIKGGEHNRDRARRVFYSLSDELQVNVFLIGRLCHNGDFSTFSYINPDTFAEVGEAFLASRGEEAIGAISAKIEQTQYWNVLNALTQLLVVIDDKCKCVNKNQRLLNSLKKVFDKPPKISNRFDKKSYGQFLSNISKLNIDENQIK